MTVRKQTELKPRTSHKPKPRYSARPKGHKSLKPKGARPSYKPTRGFESVHHHWDPAANSWIVQILPGEFYVTEGPEISSIRPTTTSGICHRLRPSMPVTTEAADHAGECSAADARTLHT